MPKNLRLAIGGCVLFWCALTLGLIVLEVRLPATDIFLFKDAGVNFALLNRFVAANLPHLPPDKNLVFSYYPPVYPFLYGLWSKVAGIGLRPSILFDCAIRVIRTLLLAWFIFPVILAYFKDPRSGAKGWAILILLTILSFLSTDGDRPDDLALAWGLLAWIFAWKNSGRGNQIKAGVALGLCGATSLTGGIFFAAGLVGAAFSAGARFRNLLVVGASAAFIFIDANLPVLLSDPNAWGRFSKQVPLSTLPYKIPYVAGHSWSDFFTSLTGALSQFTQAGLPYVFCAACLLAVNLLQRKHSFRTVLWTSGLFIPACLFVWSLQPYYLWFSCIGLLIPLFSNLAVTKRGATASIAVALLAFVPLGFREGKGWIHALERRDSVEMTRSELIKIIPPGKRVALTADQFFTLRGERSVSNVGYVCDRLEQYDYVYLTPVTSAIRTRAEPVEIPCAGKESCFTVEKDLTSHQVLKFFGFETPYYVRDSGGVLYRNTLCRDRIVSNFR
jgi:hypothetical protein